MQRERKEGRPVGRAVFLGAIGVGVAGMLAGGKVRDATQALSAIAPGGGWRIYSVGEIPRFDPTTYKLRVSGLVSTPLELSWDEVMSLERVEQTSDFHCVTGWSVTGVRWEGFRPSTLLAAAGVQPSARFAHVISNELPYEDGLTLEQLALDDVLFAHTMDGRPLTRDHGAPLRLVVPQMYGYKGVKWVGEVKLEPEVREGFWEVRGYDVDAWIGRSNGLG